MRDALTQTYPSGRSWLRHAVGPVSDPRTYARALHLLVMFPTGIAYFVALVTSLAIGLSLSWTIIGPPILLVTMSLSRWAGDAEAWAVRHLHGMELRRPPTTIERGSYRSQVWARIIDPTTWTGLIYLFVQFPIGIGTFVFLVTTTTLGVIFVISPLVVGPHTVIGLGFDGRVIDDPREAWWLPIVGVAVLLADVHLVNLLSALHAWWARLILGSRAPHIVPGAPLDTPPIDPDGEPDGAPEPQRGDPAIEGAGALIAPSRASATPVATHVQPGEATAHLLASLTPREIEVLRLIARGYSNAEIAEAFVVSEGAIKTHVKRVLAKLDLRDRTQVVVWAYEHRVVEPAAPTPPATRDASREPLRLRVRR